MVPNRISWGYLGSPSKRRTMVASTPRWRRAVGATLAWSCGLAAGGPVDVTMDGVATSIELSPPADQCFDRGMVEAFVDGQPGLGGFGCGGGDRGWWRGGDGARAKQVRSCTLWGKTTERHAHQS